MRCLRGRLLPAAADGPPGGSPVGGGTGKTLTAEDSVFEAIFSSGESTGAQLGQTMTKTPPTRRQEGILRFMMTVLISFLGGRVAPVQRRAGVRRADGRGSSPSRQTRAAIPWPTPNRANRQQ